MASRSGMLAAGFFIGHLLRFFGVAGIAKDEEAKPKRDHGKNNKGEDLVDVRESPHVERCV